MKASRHNSYHSVAIASIQRTPDFISPDRLRPVAPSNLINQFPWEKLLDQLRFLFPKVVANALTHHRVPNLVSNRQPTRKRHIDRWNQPIAAMSTTCSNPPTLTARLLDRFAIRSIFAKSAAGPPLNTSKCHTNPYAANKRNHQLAVSTPPRPRRVLRGLGSEKERESAGGLYAGRERRGKIIMLFSRK